MYRRAWIRLAMACVAVIAVSIVVSLVVSAQGQQGQQRQQGQQNPPPVYNPYPPGILPPDLVSEIERVRREVKFIFQQALAEWRALPPPNLTGQPPTLQGTGYQMVQTLGKLMNYKRSS